jgi:hypothetical protein
MSSSGMSHRVALVRTDVSEERIVSINSVTRIDELETTLAVTSNRRTLLQPGSSRVGAQMRGIISIYVILPAAQGSGVYSACNRNEYHKQKNNVSRK